MTNREAILIDETFPSNRQRLSMLPRDLENARSKCPMADDSFHNLVIVLTEAVANAINHGNGGDASKHVRLLVECTEEGVHCVVEDEGEGFDPEEVADPIAPENLLSDGGRGMFIIRALAKDLRVEKIEGGTRVEFVCARS